MDDPLGRAKRIVYGYTRAIQKSRSITMELCDEDRDFAVSIAPGEFSEEADQLLAVMSDRADSGKMTAGDLMNFTSMMRLLIDKAPGVNVTLGMSLLPEDMHYFENPMDIMVDFAELGII